MGTRVIVRGKVVWEDKESVRERKRALARWKERCDAADGIGVPIEPPPPVPGIAPKTTDALWRDESTRVEFRVVDRLNIAEGWATAETVARWFTIKLRTVHHLARNGLLAAAIERGLPTQRYRVLDVLKVREEIERLRQRAIARASLPVTALPPPAQDSAPAAMTGEDIVKEMRITKGRRKK